MLAERNPLLKSPNLTTTNASNETTENAATRSRGRRRAFFARWRRTFFCVWCAANCVATPFDRLTDAVGALFCAPVAAAVADEDGGFAAAPELALPDFVNAVAGEGAAGPNAVVESTDLARDFDAAPARRIDAATVSSNAVLSGAKTAAESARPALELDDVEEFSAETPTPNVDRLDDLNAASPSARESAASNVAPTIDHSVESSADADAESEPAIATTTALVADECFFALDPFSSLFIDYEPTAAWTEKALEYVDSILAKIEENPSGAAALIAEFRASVADVERIKAAIVADDKRLAPFYTTETPDADATGTGESSAESRTPILRYSLEQRLELFDSFRGALDRRAFVWTRAAEYFAARREGRLVAASEISAAELARLRQTTAAARKFFGDSPTGRNWRNSFEIDLLAQDVERLVAASATFVPTTSAKIGAPVSDPSTDRRAAERTLRKQYLRDRLNSVCYKLEKTPMTPEQRRVFERAPLDEWVAAMSPRACDQTNGLDLLLDFERYERSGGGQSGRALQQNARRMTTSRSEVCRNFGKAFDVVYDNPNVKAYVSEALINRLLPIRDPEFDVVQETVLNNPVAGRRRTDAQVFIELTPDPSRLLMNLNVAGRVVASTSSNVFPATLHNQSYATYIGRKTLEWRDSGLAYSPTTVSADSVNKLSAVQTEVDFVPLVGDLAREVVRSQFESKQGAIRQETKARVAAEARARIDGEANERFDAVNRRLRENFFADLSRLSLSLRTQRSKTTDEWLLASLRLGSDFSLGCQSTEPPTLPGAFADLKIHESAPNAALAELELAGKTLTPRQTLDFLAEKLNKPALADVEIDETNDLVLTFADVDPIVVRFFEDRVQLRLKFAELSLDRSRWNDVEVAVSYRPRTGSDGVATFVRDSVVELTGPTSIRAQIPLRAIFSKVFPAEKTFDLRPKILQTDERFAGLALGLCRVSRGWFAISVVCPTRRSVAEFGANGTSTSEKINRL